MFRDIGKLLILAGSFLVISGLLFLFFHRIPLLGRLPGDIWIRRENFQFFFPLVSCLVVSAVITVVVNLILGLFR